MCGCSRLFSYGTWDKVWLANTVFGKAVACDGNLALISWALRHWLPSPSVVLLGHLSLYPGP